MLGSRIVPLASIGWSLGVIALVVRSGVLTAPVATPTNTQDPLSLSIAVLKQSESFKAAAVGVVGSVPNEVLAWRIVFTSPNRDEVFREILFTGSPAGRLYALAGLWFGDATEFAVAAKSLRSQGGVIKTVRGCIAGSESVRELIQEIQSGSWSREFLAAGIVMVR